jgi:hypothetical protein
LWKQQANGGRERAMNDSEHDIRDSASSEQIDDWDDPSDDSGLSEAVDAAGMQDLSPAASDRIRHFLADSTVRGGASPSDVADLYTSNEIMADDDATAYLDRRFVHGQVPPDWRLLQDQLSLAHFDGPPSASAEALLARIDKANERVQTGRSIFADPDEDELYDVDASLRMDERDPSLSDLGDQGRRWVERYIVADVLCYGVAPFKVMQLREDLRVAGDERSLQYLDLPFEFGDRPVDWDGLRDRALMARARLESRGIDPADAFAAADASYPDVPAAELLELIEDRADRR